MRALVTADALGGVWSYTRELVTGLLRRGVEVTLVTFGDLPRPAQTHWMAGLSLDYRPTAFRLEWMQESERDLELSSEYLRGVAEEVRPDVVHLNQYGYGAVDFHAPKVVVAHSDVVSWWVAVHGSEPEETNWTSWYRKLVCRGLEGADVVVAPSRWMLNQLQRYYLKPRCVQVLHNGRSPELFRPQVAKSTRAMSVGRLWDEGKQISLLTGIKPAMPITIAGAERNPAANAEMRRGKKSSRVEFAGELGEGELSVLYRKAAVYVATSRYEPFGLAPLEAALSRCAVVANDIESLRELWGDAVYYFARNDAGSLTAALRRMATDPELRILFAGRAYAHARKHFTAERMADEYVGLYHKLVAAEVAA